MDLWNELFASRTRQVLLLVKLYGNRYSSLTLSSIPRVYLIAFKAFQIRTAKTRKISSLCGRASKCANRLFIVEQVIAEIKRMFFINTIRFHVYINLFQIQKWLRFDISLQSTYINLRFCRKFFKFHTNCNWFLLEY